MDELTSKWSRAAGRLDQAEKALKYLTGPKPGALLVVSPNVSHVGPPHIQVAAEHALLALHPARPTLLPMTTGRTPGPTSGIEGMRIDLRWAIPVPIVIGTLAVMTYHNPVGTATFVGFLVAAILIVVVGFRWALAMEDERDRYFTIGSRERKQEDGSLALVDQPKEVG